MEKWKTVEEYTNYEVSNYGRVRRCKGAYRSTYIGKILNPINVNGYFNVSLCKNNTTKIFRIHRLVLSVFVGICPVGYQCNHKDGNKLNNHTNNLEWVTAKKNTQHAIASGLTPNNKGENNYLARLTKTEVLSIRRLRVKHNHSYNKLATMFGVSKSNISFIINQQTWKHI